MKTTIALIAAALFLPLFATSCRTTAGTAVAGAATYAAIDNHREEERREDYVKAKHYQNKKRENNRNR